MKSLTQNITLEPYDRKWENEAKNQHGGKYPAEMLGEFQKIFNNWSDQILEALEKADAEKSDDKDVGPQFELDYWKSRMRKLTGVSE